MPGPWLALRRLRFRRRDDHERLELEEALLPDATDVHQLLGLRERTVLLPVLDDPIRRGGADAGQALQVGRRGGVDVDGRDRRLRGRWTRSGILGLSEGRAEQTADE